jgi:hypothetical protein
VRQCWRADARAFPSITVRTNIAFDRPTLSQRERQQSPDVTTNGGAQLYLCSG